MGRPGKTRGGVACGTPRRNLVARHLQAILWQVEIRAMEWRAFRGGIFLMGGCLLSDDYFTVVWLRKGRYKGLEKIDWLFALSVAAYNLVRM